MIQLHNERDGRQVERVFPSEATTSANQRQKKQWQSATTTTTNRAGWPTEGRSGASPSQWAEQLGNERDTKHSTLVASDMTLVRGKKEEAARGSLVNVITKPIRLIQMKESSSSSSSRSTTTTTTTPARDSQISHKLVAKTTTTSTTCCNRMSAAGNHPTAGASLRLAVTLAGSYCLLLACSILVDGAPLNKEPQVAAIKVSSQQQHSDNNNNNNNSNNNNNHQHHHHQPHHQQRDGGNNNGLAVGSGRHEMSGDEGRRQRAATVFGVLDDGRARRLPAFSSEQLKRSGEEDISPLQSAARLQQQQPPPPQYDNQRRLDGLSDQEWAVVNRAASLGNAANANGDNEEDEEELEQLLLILASELAAAQPSNRRLNKRSGISDQRLAEIQMIRALKKQLERAASKIASESAGGGGQSGDASGAGGEQSQAATS